MAEKKNKWSVNTETGVMSCTFGDESVTSFDMTDLYIDKWDTFDLVEKETACYGAKQKLSDTIAREKDMALTDKEKADTMQAKWTSMTIDREFRTKGEGRQSALEKFRIGYQAGTITKATLKIMVENGILKQAQVDEIIK